MTKIADRVVAEVMNPRLLYIHESDRLSLARTQILKFGVTAVPVLDDQHRPVGVVSLRDIVAEGKDVVARTPVLTVRASDTAMDAARMLAEHDVHHVVVVDDAGVAVGMLSAVDLVRAWVGAAPRHPEPFERYREPAAGRSAP